MSYIWKKNFKEKTHILSQIPHIQIRRERVVVKFASTQIGLVQDRGDSEFVFSFQKTNHTLKGRLNTSRSVWDI